jgi:hypothetical protein
MAKRRGQGTSKTKAIQNTLDRLGMQSSPEQVVGALAEFGIDVPEALVRRVRPIGWVTLARFQVLPWLLE